jgi:hypothetical protein
MGALAAVEHGNRVAEAESETAVLVFIDPVHLRSYTSLLEIAHAT